MNQPQQPLSPQEAVLDFGVEIVKHAHYGNFDADRIEVFREEAENTGHMGLVTLFINHKDVFEGTPIDIEVLVESLTEPGDYELLTCGCGIAGCAGFSETVRIEHDGDVIRWTMLQAYEGYYEFERKQYHSALNKLLAYMVLHDARSDLGINSDNPDFYPWIYDKFKEINTQTVF